MRSQGRRHGAAEQTLIGKKGEARSSAIASFQRSVPRNGIVRLACLFVFGMNQERPSADGFRAAQSAV